jgi:hypothetical protein
MSNSKFEAGRYCRQNEPKEKSEGNYTTRVTVTEGTKPQSRSRAVEGPVLDQAQPGNIHRDSRGDVWETHDLNHEPWTTAHRPEPTDLGKLKSHQQAMLTKRQKAKNRSSKGRQA